jgi:hypothetical protein
VKLPHEVTEKPKISFSSRDTGSSGGNQAKLEALKDLPDVRDLSKYVQQINQLTIGYNNLHYFAKLNPDGSPRTNEE